MKEDTQTKERRPAGDKQDKHEKHEHREGHDHKSPRGKEHDHGHDHHREHDRDHDHGHRPGEREHDREHRRPEGDFRDPREHHRHGRGGGPGPRDRARRGEVRFLLLDALRDGPKHGYEIIKAIEERSAGQYAPSPGTVYPTLQLLEDQALVRADAEGERRVYALTEAGQTELAAREDYVKAFWSRFAPSPATAAARHEVGFLKESLEDLNRTIWRGLYGVIEQGDQAAIRRVRQSIEQCRNDIRVIIAEAPDNTVTTPATNAGGTKQP